MDMERSLASYMKGTKMGDPVNILIGIFSKYTKIQ